MAHCLHLKSISVGWLMVGLSVGVAASTPVNEATPAAATTSPSAPASAPGNGKPQVIALIAAVGDQMTLVRQKPSVGSHMEPYTRQTLHTDDQVLNVAVLKGLDEALAQEEPGSQRVMLRWVAPDATREALQAADKAHRGDVLLDAIRGYLRMVPDHEQWDRIEVVVPHYSYLDRHGMGNKLDGVGIYVQPLKSMDVSLDATGNITENEADGDFKTVDPTTGLVSNKSTFVAPYFYFDRVTLDARTLAVVARKSQFSDIKYNDPNSPALDILRQMPPEVLMQHVADLVQRSAYQSVRGLNSGEVTVGPVVAVQPAAAASATAPTPP